MKKRSLTLIEVMIALGIASLLLAVMFPYLRDTLRIKKQIETEKAFVFAKAHVQERLASLFAKTAPSGAFKTAEEKEDPKQVQFEFDNGYDYDENFRGHVMGHLYLEKGKLMLKILGKQEQSRNEVLLEEVQNITFEFTRANKGNFEVVNTWTQNELPLFFTLHVLLPGDKKELFYFRLHSLNRLEYP